MIPDAPCRGQDWGPNGPRRCDGDEGGPFAARLWHKGWTGRLLRDERPLSARSLDVRSWPVIGTDAIRPSGCCIMPSRHPGVNDRRESSSRRWTPYRGWLWPTLSRHSTPTKADFPSLRRCCSCSSNLSLKWR